MPASSAYSERAAARILICQPEQLAFVKPKICDLVVGFDVDCSQWKDRLLSGKGEYIQLQDDGTQCVVFT